jgi:hypothetical protein
MGDALRVVARLSSRMAGDPPHLDALLVSVASRLAGKPDIDEGYKIGRDGPCPVSPAIPLLRRRCGSVADVAACTSPILDTVTDDNHAYYAKKFAVEHALLLSPAERQQVNTTGGPLKSYRLPLRVRRVGRVAWLCVGDRREIVKLLRYVSAIGKKLSQGYGRVAEWTVERIDVDRHEWWPWWVDSPGGPVLMRPLPQEWAGLPAGLLGWRLWYGGVTDPYWHPDRQREIIEPC